MNFQDKVIETTADFRARAAALAQTAFVNVRARANATTGRVARLKTSLTALQAAGRELNKVARRHVFRFVQQNASIARDAGKDVSALARSTYQQLADRKSASARKPRKTAARKRNTSAARSRATKAA